MIPVMETSCETRTRPSGVAVLWVFLYTNSKEIHNLGVCLHSKQPGGIKKVDKKNKKKGKTPNISTCAPVLNLSNEGLGGLTELLPKLLFWPRSPQSQLAASSGLCPSGSVVDCGSAWMMSAA